MSMDVYREHTCHITNAKHLLAGEFPVYITLQSDHVINIRYMSFPI